MAAVALMPSMRRPFQTLGESRLQHLGNIKNRQNALVPPTIDPPTISKKRVYEQSSDSENVDPALFLQSKQGKFSLDDVKSQTVLTTATKTSARAKLPLPTTRQFPNTNLDKPKFTATPAPRVQSGRSPVKGKGMVSRRRKTTRINPPNFGSGSDLGFPISLDNALSGTVGSYTSNGPQSHGLPNNTTPNNGTLNIETKPMLDEGIRKSWRFQIHEDSEDAEEENLLEHSACRMDISDDEGSAAKDDRGKENIPPMDGMFAPAPINTAVPASRKNMMTDEPRTPLGDLIASEFYGEGLDADSTIIISVDDGEKALLDNPDCGHQPTNDASPEDPNHWKELLADIDVSKTSGLGGSMAPVKEEISNEAVQFDIWESESSKGDDDAPIQSELCTLAASSNAE